MNCIAGHGICRSGRQRGVGIPIRGIGAALTLALSAVATAAVHPGVPASTALPEAVDVATTPGQSAVATREDASVALPLTRDTGLTRDQLSDPTPTSATMSAAGGAAPTDASPLAFDPATMMRSADVRPGMKGYGLTVFQGVRPQRFEAEVVGVRHVTMVDMDIILCRLKYPGRIEGAGVIAGMSGSPVYINDKVIGAVAYGWPTNQEPLADITLIEKMLQVFNATPGAQPSDADVQGTSFYAYDAYMQMRRNLTLPKDPPSSR